MSLLQSSQNIVLQIEEMVAQLSDKEFTTTLDLFSGASMGQHTRHIIEFYQCILKEPKVDEICYDNRERNKLIENDRTFCIETLKLIYHQLGEIQNDYSLNIITQIGAERCCTPSSLYREILYSFEHAVHHMAILKIGIIPCFPNVKLADNFGVAESTIRYRQECAQ